jgi:hypothetical protein
LRHSGCYLDKDENKTVSLFFGIFGIYVVLKQILFSLLGHSSYSLDILVLLRVLPRRRILLFVTTPSSRINT